MVPLKDFFPQERESERTDRERERRKRGKERGEKGIARIEWELKWALS